KKTPSSGRVSYTNVRHSGNSAAMSCRDRMSLPTDRQSSIRLPACQLSRQLRLKFSTLKLLAHGANKQLVLCFRRHAAGGLITVQIGWKTVALGRGLCRTHDHVVFAVKLTPA